MSLLDGLILDSLRNVAQVFVNPAASPGTISRLIVLNNMAEWPDAAAYSNTVGLKLDGGSGSSTTIFKNVLARGNVFRRPVGTSPNGNEIGLSFKNCTNVIVENNLADVGSSPNNLTRFEVCGTVKAFNNRKPDGVFSAAYNVGTGLHSAELTTDVEDALLAI